MLKEVRRGVKFWREYAGNRNLDSIDEALPFSYKNDIFGSAAYAAEWKF